MIVAQGQTVTLLASWLEYPGGPAVDVTGLTITITPVAGGAAVVGPTSTGISHPATGVYTYTWAVSASQPPGDYLISWSGMDADSDTVTAAELVTVLGTGEGGTFATIRLTTIINNDAGALIDPATVAVEVLLPGGLAAGPFTGVRESLGVYYYDYQPTAAGLHIARWTTTSPVGVDEESFDVQPAYGAPWISLADFKDHLKRSGIATNDDEKLRGILASGCQMITDRMGEISPVTVIHDADLRGDTIVLPKRPVISITSVQRLPGLAAIPQADRATGVSGWSLASSEGVLVHTGGWFGPVRVIYRAGRNPIPANFRLAGLELGAHLWRTSQLNSGGGRPSVSTDEVIVPGSSWAMPYSVRQLLGLDKRPQDEILVG